jgi:two-component system chemotaxis response regulator CheB
VTIRILVVDDSVVIRKLLTATLAEVPGMAVVATAALGKIALAKIPEVQPDLVILDVEMPEMDGIETLKLIRKDSPRLPVIMFSTRTERGAAATIEALTSGASDYVTKPSNVGNVLVAMARVRDEMVPKIHALTGGGAPGVRPPPRPQDGEPRATTRFAALPSTASSAVEPRSTTRFAALAHAPPPPSATAAAAIPALVRPPDSEPRPITRFAALAQAPPPASGAAAAVKRRHPTKFTALPVVAAPLPAEPRPTPRVAALPVPPGPTGSPGIDEPRPATRGAALQDSLAVVAVPVIGSAPVTTPAAPPAGSVDPRVTARFTALRRPVEVVAIGASTGGPNALATLLTQLPAEFPAPIVIVQHMLATFTRHFAVRLAAQCRIKIVEANAGDLLIAGHAYIARGDHHLLVERRAGRPCLAMNQDEFENFCRPAVDVLFRSVAQVYGAAALGVVLTGMGHDGLAGCGAIREAGGDIIVQDEASSVVWGMPGFVARAGLASQVIPIDQLGGELRRRVGLGGPRSAEVSP